MENKDNKKNYFKLFWFILLPIILSFWLVPVYKDREIKIRKDEFPYQTFFLINDESRNRNFIGDILGTSFELDRYKICIENNTYIEKNGLQLLDNSELGKQAGNISVDIYPFRANILIGQQHQYSKEINKPFSNNNENERVFSPKPLSVKQGATNCVPLPTSEEGFFYSIPQLIPFGSVTIPPPENTEDTFRDITISKGVDVFQPKGNFKFFIKNDNLVYLLAKKIVFISLWAGFFLLWVEVFKYIKNDN